MDPNHENISASDRKLFEATNFVVAWFQAQGLVVHPSSRVGRIRRLLCNDDGSPRPPIESVHVDWNAGIEAVREVRLLEFILDHLSLLEERAPPAKLRQLLKDSYMPEDDATRRSQGRDTQVELYVAAIACKAGMRPVRLDESPDLHVTFAGQTFGIAVKRLKVAEAFEDQVRRAAKQILRSKLPGVIAMDTSLAFNPSNDRIPAGVDDAVMEERHEEFFKQHIDRYYNRLLSWTGSTWVRGLILHDHQIRNDAHAGWGIDSLTYLVPTAQNMARRRELDAFFATYRQGLATPPS